MQKNAKRKGGNGKRTDAEITEKTTDEQKRMKRLPKECRKKNAKRKG